MMKMMKRRRFGSIGGRVDATFFLVFLSLSLSLVESSSSRVFMYIRVRFSLSLVSLKNYYLGFNIHKSITLTLWGYSSWELKGKQ